ncbi:MAG: hypothetical protein ACPGII_05745 [Opitutales bacterium]|tara:strand:- start:151 stop:372 length:222 start_codon:yes stop_codon:yes gene_type:complete
MSKNETEQIAGIFRNLGADQDQAITMARQLIKRAEQLAEEKNSTKVSELQALLETAICGAQGILKPDKKGDSE